MRTMQEGLEREAQERETLANECAALILNETPGDKRGEGFVRLEIARFKELGRIADALTLIAARMDDGR